MQAVLLVYDIPDTAHVRNPSRQLRRIAFRANLSCWVIREDLIPWNLLDELAQAGAEWHTVQFADGESKKLLQMALSAIRKESARAVGAMNKSLTRAEQLAENGEPERYARRAAAAARRAERMLDALENAAACFELSPDDVHLPACRQRFSALEAASHARAAIYGGMVRTAQEANLPLADVAQQSAVPPLILADYLEEQTYQDMGAAREAFTPSEVS